MNEKDFLLGIKEMLEVSEDDGSGDLYDKVVRAQKALQKRIDSIGDGDPICGLYCSDMSRVYGYNFAQLKRMVRDYQDPKSVFYKKDREVIPVLKWLYDVGHTSIGDIHGDLPKRVMITFHRPADFSDEQCDKVYEEYDQFWDEVRKILGYK